MYRQHHSEMALGLSAQLTKDRDARNHWREHAAHSARRHKRDGNRCEARDHDHAHQPALHRYTPCMSLCISSYGGLGLQAALPLLTVQMGDAATLQVNMSATDAATQCCCAHMQSPSCRHQPARKHARTSVHPFDQFRTFGVTWTLWRCITLQVNTDCKQQIDCMWAFESSVRSSAQCSTEQAAGR